MLKKPILRLGIPATILVISIFLLGNGKVETPATPVKNTKSTSCKKNTSSCTSPGSRNGDDMILENFSRQFISIGPL